MRLLPGARVSCGPSATSCEHGPFKKLGTATALCKRRDRILFIFVDGVGLGPAGPDNPLSQVPMPRLGELLGGPLVLPMAQNECEVGWSHAIQATMAWLAP